MRDGVKFFYKKDLGGKRVKFSKNIYSLPRSVQTSSEAVWQNFYRSKAKYLSYF
jgi:hypothetical protein